MYPIVYEMRNSPALEWIAVKQVFSLISKDPPLLARPLEFSFSPLTSALRLRTCNILTNTRLLDPICDAWEKLQALKICGVPLLFLENPG